jgi:hypothetical protein
MISRHHDLGETLAGKSRSMSRALIVLIVLIAGGCQSETPQPDFVARSQDDCTNGAQSACAMLGVLSKIALNSEPSNAPDRRRIQRDVDAILDGIDRARSLQPANRMRVAPTDTPDILQVR